jgi:hypothetical protein
VYTTEINVLRNKIKDLENEKVHLVEGHNKTKVSLEKVIKEKEKILTEVNMMKRLQMHLSNQLAGRWGDEVAEGEAHLTSPHSSVPGSENGGSRIPSAKSVKFAAIETPSRKLTSIAPVKALETKSFVRSTAASQLRQLALEEKVKEKEKQEDLLKRLREKAQKNREKLKKLKQGSNSHQDDEDPEDDSQELLNEPDENIENESQDDVPSDKDERGSDVDESEQSSEEEKSLKKRHHHHRHRKESSSDSDEQASPEIKRKHSSKSKKYSKKDASDEELSEQESKKPARESKKHASMKKEKKHHSHYEEEE